MDETIATLQRALFMDPENTDVSLHYAVACQRAGVQPKQTALSKRMAGVGVFFMKRVANYFNRKARARLNAGPGWFRNNHCRISRATAALDLGVSECLLAHYEAAQLEQRWEPCNACIAELTLMGGVLEPVHIEAGPLFGGEV